MRLLDTLSVARSLRSPPFRRAEGLASVMRLGFSLALLGMAAVCPAREPADPDHRPAYMLSIDGDETLALACGLTVPKIRDARGFPHGGVDLWRSHPCEENRSDALELWRADQFVAAWRDPGSNGVSLLRLAYPFPYGLRPGQLLPASTYLRDARALASVGYPAVAQEHIEDWLSYYYQSGSTGVVPFQAVSTLARVEAFETCTRYDGEAAGNLYRVYVFKLKGDGKTPLPGEAWFALQLRSERAFGVADDDFAEEFLRGVKVDPAALAAERAFWDGEPFDTFSCANAVRGVRNLGGEWQVFQYGNFCLITDNLVAFETAQEGLEAQQKAYDLFPTVLFPFGPAAAGDVCVIRVYATAWEFEDSVPQTRKWAGGMYVPGSDEIVMRGWSRAGTVHECTHRYLRVASGRRGLSVWFNEGFACYFGGCKVSDGRLVAQPVDSNHMLIAMIRQGERQTVADIFTVEDFYQDKAMERNPDDPTAALKRAKNYASAWGVIYFLREAPTRYPGKGYETLIPLYWETLQRTGNPEKATEAVLRNMMKSSFLADFCDYFMTFADSEETRAKQQRRRLLVGDFEHSEFLPRARQPDFAELMFGDGVSGDGRLDAGRAGYKKNAAGERTATVQPARRKNVENHSGATAARAGPRANWAAVATGALTLGIALVWGWRWFKTGRLFVLALLLAAGRLFGEGAETNGYTLVYRVIGDVAVLGDGATCAVTPKPEGKFELPEKLDGHPVAGIGAYAFSECEELTALTLPKTLTEIGECAFYGCRELKEISLPESVAEIGAGAFFLCSNLRRVSIPQHVTVVPEWAFGRCFRLSSVQFGKNVGAIGNEAFLGCAALTAVELPKSVAVIGDRAFKWCSGLQTAVLEGPVTAIGSEVFAGCTDLSEVALPETVTVLGEGAFKWCSALRRLKVPEHVTVIGSHAFYGCRGLESLAIPDAVAEIGDYAFSGCQSLEHLELGEGVAVLGSHAFYACSALSSIAFPASLADIGDAAFSRCSALFSVTLPPSLTVLEAGVFRECTGLVSVTLPPSVTVIGEAAFEQCSRLSSVTLPDSVRALGASAFAGCVGLSQVTLGKAVSKIGSSAFRNCEGLRSLEVPASVTGIGGKAFERCDRLFAVYYGGNAPAAGADIYAVTPDMLTSYVLPGTTGWRTPIPGEWKDRPIQYQALIPAAEE